MFIGSCRTLARTLATLVLCKAGVAALAPAAQAQGAPPPVVIRFVSSSGLDSNTCTRAAPCHTLQKGINATPDGGELQILDSSAYGNKATITRSITISAVGVSATVGSLAIDAPGARVVLRGLLLKRRDASEPDGILVTNAAAVHIVRCEIEGFAGDGIRIVSANTEVFVSDTIVRGNGSSGFSALSNIGSRLTIDNSRFEDNGSHGILVRAPSTTSTITRVVASGNGSSGIHNNFGRMNVTSTTVANNVEHGFDQIGGSMTIEASVARGNGGAGLSVAVGIARVSASVITDNDVGLQVVSGTMESRGNNTVGGNTNPIIGAVTLVPGI